MSIKESLNRWIRSTSTIIWFSGLFKDGGRVRGCKIAKRGFGKAMKRKNETIK